MEPDNFAEARKLVEAGYVPVSNKYRTITRLDVDLKAFVAESPLQRGCMLTSDAISAKEHYCRCYSKDKKVLTQEEFSKVKSIYNKTVDEYRAANPTPTPIDALAAMLRTQTNASIEIADQLRLAKDAISDFVKKFAEYELEFAADGAKGRASECFEMVRRGEEVLWKIS